MSLLFNEFKRDLDHLRKLILLTDDIKGFSANSVVGNTHNSDNEFLTKSLNLQTVARDANVGLTFVAGTLVLYLAGRFEFYVRGVFEELALAIADRCVKFDNLPKEFKENLFLYTAEVMKAPRKYGHAENGRNTFITNLSNNINGLDLTSINVKCLSITTENMRSGVLGDLYSRLGVKDVWVKIGQNTRIQVFFENGVPVQATDEAKRKLDNFMDVRNMVAHPSDSFSWPDSSTVLNFLNFIEELSFVLNELSAIYVLSLSKPPNPLQVVVQS